MLLLGREIKVRYRQTALGAVWVILQPLVPAVIFTVVLGTFARLPFDRNPVLPLRPRWAGPLRPLLVIGVQGLVGIPAGRCAGHEGLSSRGPCCRLATGVASIVDFAVGAGLLILLMVASGWIPSLPSWPRRSSPRWPSRWGSRSGWRSRASAPATATSHRGRRSSCSAAVRITRRLLNRARPDAANPLRAEPMARAPRGVPLVAPRDEGLDRRAILARVGAIAAVGALVLFSRATRDLTDVL